MVKMFISRVRPILEYNCELWSPHYVTHIDWIESIQRTYTRRIDTLFELSYRDRLRYCNLELLELRRLKRDLCLVYKIIHGLIDLHFNEFFEYVPHSRTRGHVYKLYPKHGSTIRCLTSFAFRVVNPWNSLSSHVVESASINIFKHKLNRINEHLETFLSGRAIRNP